MDQRPLGRRLAADRDQRGADRPGMGDHQRRTRAARDHRQRCPRALHLLSERLSSGEREAFLGGLERREQLGRDGGDLRRPACPPSSRDRTRSGPRARSAPRRSPRRRRPRSGAPGAAASTRSRPPVGGDARREPRGLLLAGRRQRRIAPAENQAMRVVRGLAVPGEQHRHDHVRHCRARAERVLANVAKSAMPGSKTPRAGRKRVASSPAVQIDE